MAQAVASRTPAGRQQGHCGAPILLADGAVAVSGAAARHFETSQFCPTDRRRARAVNCIARRGMTV